ncbi:hypothetical protein GCM10023187_43470 [Nibrella viscosa]|uniref:Uncharacterized protein n=1 Tax=Nibrella viscosa TaxID=1084524 RepID=A0ABP8KRG2_9BACT
MLTRQLESTGEKLLLEDKSSVVQNLIQQGLGELLDLSSQMLAKLNPFFKGGSADMRFVAVDDRGSTVTEQEVPDFAAVYKAAKSGDTSENTDVFLFSTSKVKRLSALIGKYHPVKEVYFTTRLGNSDYLPLTQVSLLCQEELTFAPEQYQYSARLEWQHDAGSEPIMEYTWRQPYTVSPDLPAFEKKVRETLKEVLSQIKRSLKTK